MGWEILLFISLIVGLMIPGYYYYVVREKKNEKIIKENLGLTINKITAILSKKGLPYETEFSYIPRTVDECGAHVYAVAIYSIRAGSKPGPLLSLCPNGLQDRIHIRLHDDPDHVQPMLEKKYPEIGSPQELPYTMSDPLIADLANYIIKYSER